MYLSLNTSGKTDLYMHTLNKFDKSGAIINLYIPVPQGGVVAVIYKESTTL